MVSVRWVAPILLFVVALPVFGAKKSSSQPPRELHRVGDHWTAYNPPDPATYPPGSKSYTIKRGDTLWGLAQQLYNNAYLWPQLWEANTWITDSHWIYPGDVLLVEGEVAQQAAAGTTTGAAAGTTGATATPTTLSGGMTGQQPTTTASGLRAGGTAGTGTSAPVPLGAEADLYCFGYLGDPREPLPNSVASYEDVEMRYEPGALDQRLGGVEGDLLYIDGGTATGIITGETYLVVQPGEMILHPATKAIVGRHYDFKGQVRIIRADERRSCAVIVATCDVINLGDKLKPMPQLPIPLARIPAVPGFCEPRAGKANGYIVNAQGGWSDTLAEGLLVEINLGHDDQLQPGDFLTVWRDSIQPGQPPQILGQIGVLTTEAHTATGKVVSTRYTMRVGDHVEIR
jgi:LysM repeat protein